MLTKPIKDNIGFKSKSSINAYFTSKQLTLQVSRYCLLSFNGSIARLCLENHLKIFQSQKAVSAYFTSKKLLPFGFTRQRC